MKIYKVWTSDLSAPVLIIKAESLQEAVAQSEALTKTKTDLFADLCPRAPRSAVIPPKRSWKYRISSTIIPEPFSIGKIALKCSKTSLKN